MHICVGNPKHHGNINTSVMIMISSRNGERPHKSRVLFPKLGGKYMGVHYIINSFWMLVRVRNFLIA